jgi:protein-S-isoprenylcysteine O-methyltransferase Ste14
MSNQGSPQANITGLTPGQWVKRIGVIVLLVLAMNAILLLVAGKWDWTGAWVLSFLYLAFVLFFFIRTTIKDPELMRERSHKSANVKPWDTVISIVYTIMLVGMLVVAALDVGHFRWSQMSLIWLVAGVIGFLAVGLLILWITDTNPYLSSYARIQEDRGQRVITTGPYRMVRHPMYAALIPFVICIALILGSWVALIPGGVIIVLFFIRTALEDRMLQDELPGYVDYTRQTRYRLVPWVW